MKDKMRSRKVNNKQREQHPFDSDFSYSGADNTVMRNKSKPRVIKDSHTRKVISNLEIIAEGMRPVREVVLDFINIYALKINISCQYNMNEVRKMNLDNIISKYDKKEIKLFDEAFEELSIATTAKGENVLGYLFYKYNLLSSKYDQVYTDTVLYTKTILQDKTMSKYYTCGSLKDIKTSIQENGMISLLNAFCGFGSFPIMIANILKKRELSKYIKFYFIKAGDIDINMVMCCYINCFLLGFPALIYRADLIHDKRYNTYNEYGEDEDKWYTPDYYNLIESNNRRLMIPTAINNFKKFYITDNVFHF